MTETLRVQGTRFTDANSTRRAAHGAEREDNDGGEPAATAVVLAAGMDRDVWLDGRLTEGGGDSACGRLATGPMWTASGVNPTLVAFGLAAGLSGLWMAQFYPRQSQDGVLLWWFRMVSGGAMVLCLALGFLAIHRRDVAAHGAWMTRGYALGMGAGTQALLHLPWIALLGTPGVLARALLMGAGWWLNLLVAETFIRGTRRRTG